MNSSIIHDDIRRRSIRVQRDQLLEKIRQEEEIDNMSIPKRFILEAEERARERVQGQNWKKTLFLSLIILIIGFILLRILRALHRPKMEMEIQTEIQTEDPPRTVRFDDGQISKLEKLKMELPDAWKTLTPDHSPDDLNSDISGHLMFDFYDEEGRVAVDIDPEDFFQFPNSLTNDEIRFQNMIYDRNLKRRFCEDNEIEYYEFTL